MLSAALPAMAEETTQAAGKTPVVDFENRETSQLDSSAAEMVLSESTPPETEISSQEVSDAQKLEVSYTLALNAINAEDYEKAKVYLNTCFVYCDPNTNPIMYADLLLKRACIDVIEQNNDMALVQLDAALRVQPDLADAYLVRTQVYTTQGKLDAAVEDLEKYIELKKDTSFYQTLAQLHEARGDLEAAQAAYDKYVQHAGAEVPEAGFQSGLYKMEAGRYEGAIKAFEKYTEDETFGAGAQYNIGVCKMNLGDNAGAADAFTASADKGGTYDGLYYNRGLCHLLNSEWEAAAEDFARSAKDESFKDNANYNLGICRLQMEDYASAQTSFTDLINTMEQAKAEGKQTEVGSDALINGAYYYRGVCSAALGNHEAAIKDYTVCIEHGYELTQSYYQRAQSNAATGDTEKQNSDLQTWLSLAK